MARRTDLNRVKENEIERLLYLLLAAALGASTRGAVAGDGVTAAAATAAAAAADGAAAPSQLQGIAGNLYPVFKNYSNHSKRALSLFIL